MEPFDLDQTERTWGVAFRLMCICRSGFSVVQARTAPPPTGFCAVNIETQECPRSLDRKSNCSESLEIVLVRGHSIMHKAFFTSA